MTGIFHGISDTNPEFLLLSVEHFCLVVLLGLVVDGKNHDDIDIDDYFCRCWFTYQFFLRFMHTHVYGCRVRDVCVYGSMCREVAETR